MIARTSRLWYRSRQAFSQISVRPSAEIDQALMALLTPPQWRIVERLAPADRTHLLGVHRQLILHGHTDPDLLLAALLHDAGKADDQGRVTFVHRVLNVVLHRLSPALRDRVSTTDSWLGHGMYLARHHARLGAELARNAGANERACWLIEHHDGGTIPEDATLAILQEFDSKG